MSAKIGFQNDYSDGAHPAILAALTKGNVHFQPSYAQDEYSQDAQRLIRQKTNHPDAAVYLVASGTLANIIAIGSCLRPHEAVIAANTGHLVVREAGAIEATGHKIITVRHAEGKLTTQGILQVIDENSHFPHMSKPRMVCLSNATEAGTFYRKAELTAIADLCRSRGLLLYLDGARLGVALAAEQSDLNLEDIARLTDMFWIGGTKVGALLGEAIVITNPTLKEDFSFHIKQRGGLLAKGRVLGLQFQELFRENLFFDLALHANKMAKALSDGIQQLRYDLVNPTETNQVFPIFPDSLVEKLQETFFFEVWDKLGNGKLVIRLVTSWATSTGQVEAFLGKVRQSSTD